LIVLNVREEKARARQLSWGEQFSRMALGKAKNRDLALFTRQFATVMEAGIPLVRGLRGLAADTPSRVLARAIGDLGRRIERGEGLSDALAAHPEAFNKMYVSMARAGERAGTLDAILEELAVYLEKVDAIRTKVRAAMSYPIFILIFAFLATLFLLFKIVPTFAEIYASFGQQLPGLTQLIVNISNAIRTHAVLTIGILAAVVLVFYLLTRSGPGRYALDRFLLGVPIFGPIIRKAVMSRFCRTLGILLHSGLPILDSLELARGTTGNVVVSGAISRAKELVGSGHGITESFRATRKFPEMVLQLMATGEESGDIDGMLIKASDFYDRQVEASVHGLTSLIEPLLIVVVGGLIGIVVVSMFLPIFYLGDAVMKRGFSY